MQSKPREIITRSYYHIPWNEKARLYASRLFILGGMILRQKLNRIIPYRLKTAREVFECYFPKYELAYVKEKLGIEGTDTMSAVKLLTYFHTLTGVIGEITEMSPERSVRIEHYCPLQKNVTKEFCSSVLSYPTFCAICHELNPKIEHQHTDYLSGGDDVCRLVFELKKESVDEI